MKIAVRAATADDLAFARELYLRNMRAVTEPLLVWDEARQAASFDVCFHPGEVSIVTLGERDIGWMQVAESAGEIFLRQFFIHPDVQRRGIGAGLLQGLLQRAARAGKPVRLGVVRTNPARSLYERHGFRITSEDAVKFHMEKAPPGAKA